MSRVITFSRVFPSYHPRKGEPTYFVEKIWRFLVDVDGYSEPLYFFDELQGLDKVISGSYFNDCLPKNHTIRAGNRWKVGDKFSPRVWGNAVNPKTGRTGPYQSKQIIIAPDIEIKKVWPVEILAHQNKLDFQVLQPTNKKNEWKMLSNGEVANNDGLSYDDFINWFSKTKRFSGQIICWNENINY